MTDGELRSRQEIHDLSAAYARGVDRREYGLLEPLFTADACIDVYYGDPATSKPAFQMQGRDEVLRLMRTIEQYERTTHFVGQQSVRFANSARGESPNRATGETYCLAHHLYRPRGELVNWVMSIRYQDEYVHSEGRWKFAKRTLLVDWSEERPVQFGA